MRSLISYELLANKTYFLKYWIFARNKIIAANCNIIIYHSYLLYFLCRKYHIFIQLKLL